MRLFRQRPLTVEAMQYDGTNEAEISAWRGYGAYMCTGEWIVRTADREFIYLYDDEMTERYEPVLLAEAL